MPLSDTIHSALCLQIEHERYNEHRYLVRASLADFYGLSGISCFLRKQADGERDHAMKLYQYVLDRNAKVSNTQIMFDSTPEGTMLDILGGVLKIEQDTTASLSNIYSLANMEGDFMTSAWLIAGLIPEQIEEECAIQSIIDRYNARLNNGSLAGESMMAAEVGAALHDLDVFVKENYCG